MDAAVIIAGAGPAGLTLAGELRLAGIDVIVLERLVQPTGESRGLGFTARTMEVFDQRGLLGRFGDIENSNVGHFGGLPLDLGVLEGAHLGGKGIPQARTEEVLSEWATELGADIRRGYEVVQFADHGGGVDVDVRGPLGRSRLRACYLVGCDGGRSMVRKMAGFDFPGTPATLEMFIADVTGCDIEPRWAGETKPNGMIMAGPLGDGVTRIVVCERDRAPHRRTEAPDFDEVAAGWQRLTGQDITGGTAVWASAFGNATRQVTEYRRGNVLLAGDAAHIHLPAGGQGMNTSIQDAVNLGWKLAAVVNGHAPAGLLDTYHSERHAVGRRLMMNTQAQGLLFLSGDVVQPLRDVMTELMGHREVARHLAALISGLEIRYEVDAGDHSLLGLRMPRQELNGVHGRTSTTELLHPGHGVLLDLADSAGLRDVAGGWTDRVDVVTANLPRDDAGPLAETPAILLRPDGYVAWAAPHGGETGADPGTALRRWFGAATRKYVTAA
jgi:bifunctional hydroxylase/dehydrase